jgi:hypothetical protein
MNNFILVAAAGIAALAGGAAASFLPSAQIAQAASQLSTSGYSIADLNPIRAAYDMVKTKIQIGTTPEQLGIHASPPLNFAIDPKIWEGVSSAPISGIQNNWGQSIAAQNMQFNNRMEDMRNAARNPGAWHGASPF